MSMFVDALIQLERPVASPPEVLRSLSAGPSLEEEIEDRSSSQTSEREPQQPLKPNLRRIALKGGRVRKYWDSGEWMLSEQDLALPDDELPCLNAPNAQLASESLPRRYWAPAPSRLAPSQ